MPSPSKLISPFEATTTVVKRRTTANCSSFHLHVALLHATFPWKPSSNGTFFINVKSYTTTVLRRNDSRMQQRGIFSTRPGSMRGTREKEIDCSSTSRCNSVRRGQKCFVAGRHSSAEPEMKIAFPFRS